MKLDDDALPIHRDAEIKVRPRIFFEGNLFFDLRPGTPSAGEMEDGGTIPASQTSAPVQLDEVLTTLSFDVRRDLQVLVQGFGEALDGEPRAAEDRDQDPDVRGDTAGEALNDALDDSPEALRGTALVNEAYLRLIDVQHVDWQNRAHFLAMSARLMRRILVDYARSKGSQKRGGGAMKVTFDEGLPVAGEPAISPRCRGGRCCSAIRTSRHRWRSVSSSAPA